MNLYQKAGVNMGANPFILEMDCARYMDLVHMACATLMSYFHPHSPLFVDPFDTAGEQFSERARVLSHYCGLGCSGPVCSPFSGQLVYLWVWNQVEFLNQYVEWRNTTDQHIVGHQHQTEYMVYEALRRAQNWKVECIKISHVKNGPNFGSATGWHTQDVAEGVRNWPEKFKWHLNIQRPEPLPVKTTEVA